MLFSSPHFISSLLHSNHKSLKSIIVSYVINLKVKFLNHFFVEVINKCDVVFCINVFSSTTTSSNVFDLLFWCWFYIQKDSLWEVRKKKFIKLRYKVELYVSEGFFVRLDKDIVFFTNITLISTIVISKF